MRGEQATKPSETPVSITLHRLKERDLNAWFILVSLLILISLSWYYMLFDMTMNMEPVSHWDSMDITMLFVMWAIMMVGMMLPSALPVVMLVDRVNQQRKSRQSPYTQTAYFVLGYLLCWAFYSLLITFVQWWLHLAAILSPMMVSANSFFSGVLLVVAGIYQWSPLKQKCLKFCRSPLSLMTTQWKEGVWGAISLGIKHGQFCLGCCWFLMALLFVTGVMNLKWILVLTLIVLLEKVIPRGEVVSKVLGLVLVLIGGGLLI